MYGFSGRSHRISLHGPVVKLSLLQAHVLCVWPHSALGTQTWLWQHCISPSLDPIRRGSLLQSYSNSTWGSLKSVKPIQVASHAASLVCHSSQECWALCMIDKLCILGLREHLACLKQCAFWKKVILILWYIIDPQPSQDSGPPCWCLRVVGVSKGCDCSPLPQVLWPLPSNPQPRVGGCSDICPSL